MSVQCSQGELDRTLFRIAHVVFHDLAVGPEVRHPVVDPGESPLRRDEPRCEAYPRTSSPERSAWAFASIPPHGGEVEHLGYSRGRVLPIESTE